MSINLIDLIKGQLGSSVISQAANQLGESESGVSKAVSALLPTILGGFANSSSSTQSSLLDAVKNLATSGSLNNVINGMSNESASSPIIATILNMLFGGGDKLSSVISSISNFAGISNNSASSLMNLVTGATAGSIGKYAVDHNLDSGSFSNLLNSQKSLLSGLLPAGFSLASLGLGNWFGGSDPATSNFSAPKVDVNRGPSTHHVNTSTNDESSGSIWKWLLPLLLLLLLGWFFWKQCNKQPESTTVVTADSTIVETDTLSSAPVVENGDVSKETVMVTLPSGKTLQAYKGGIEDQIVSFLKSDDYKNSTEDQLKDRWFNFDNLNFEFGTTKLTAESQIQLDNLKAILAEFPDAKVKVGAYTDKKGDENANLKLSQERANAVKSALNSAQVVAADGYGSKFATVSADASDKERESDRKTAIRFVK